MDKYQGNARIFKISYPESMASSVSVSCCQVRRWGNGINIKRFDWLFMITRTESYLGMTTADWGDRWLWVQEWNIYWNRLAVSQGLLRMSTQFFKRHSLSYYQLAIFKHLSCRCPATYGFDFQRRVHCLALTVIVWIIPPVLRKIKKSKIFNVIQFVALFCNPRFPNRK